MSVTAEQIRIARKMDLYEYLSLAHPDEIKREGHWLRMKSNPSLCMKKGLGGYKDYATNETGNSIDFLVRHLDYDFVTAVTKLTESGSCAVARDPPIRTIFFPEKAKDTGVIRSYLAGRGFTETVLDRLIADNLLYQDTRKNAVFRSKKDDFFELRGTRPGKVFHQCGKAAPNCFWYFIPDEAPRRAFICESAIDAVSLYLLALKKGTAEKTDSAFCGIGGVSNQQAIERIQRWLPTVIAVDNDEAGRECRARNPSLRAIVPRKKDWNEELIALKGRYC